MRKATIIAFCMIAFALSNSCGGDEESPKCAFTFKEEKYISNNVFCQDQEEDLTQYGMTGPGLTLTARGNWGALEIDQRVNYIGFDDIENAVYTNFSYYYSNSPTISRDGNTLVFDALLKLELNGVVYSGTISGSCTCTEVR